MNTPSNECAFGNQPPAWALHGKNFIVPEDDYNQQSSGSVSSAGGVFFSLS